MKYPLLNHILSQKAFHGSPNDFESFDLEMSGSGDGNARGWGVYFSKNPKSAAFYTKQKGFLYQADIPEDKDLLDWDIPLSKQPKLHKILKDTESYKSADERAKSGAFLSGQQLKGGEFYGGWGHYFKKQPKEISEELKKLGIPGITYLTDKVRNYVIWDTSKIKNLKKVDPQKVASQYPTLSKVLASQDDWKNPDVLVPILMYLAGDDYDDGPKLLVKTNFPEKWRKAPSVLYRGEKMDAKYIEKLKAGETVEAWGISWTPSLKIARGFALDNDGRYGVIFETTVNPSQVALNVKAMWKDPEFQAVFRSPEIQKKIREKWYYGKTNEEFDLYLDEEEILLKTNLDFSWKNVHQIIDKKTLPKAGWFNEDDDLSFPLAKGKSA